MFKNPKNLVLRTKTKPPAPRPHTVHIESGGGDARSVSMRTDRTVTLNGKKTTRARTYSDPVETEQDENKARDASIFFTSKKMFFDPELI